MLLDIIRFYLTIEKYYFLEQVSINTSQNVQISYRLAGLTDRIFAYLIDGVVVFAITMVLFIIISATNVIDTNPFLLVVALLPAFFYHLILEIAQQGQTIGKKALDIKVVKLDGSQASVGAYLLRWIIRPVDFLLYGGVAILCITIGGKGQRLGDMAAGTTVIKLKKSGFLEDHTLTDLDENYKPVFLNADELSSEHIELINKAIKAKLEMLDEKPVQAIAVKTKQLLNISTDLPDLKFLHTIVKDHHHLKLAEEGN